MKMAMVQRLYYGNYIVYVLLDVTGKFHYITSNESLIRLGERLLNYRICRNKKYKPSDDSYFQRYDERDITKKFIIKSLDLYDIRDITSDLYGPRIAVAKGQGRTDRDILTELAKMWVAENKNGLIVRETMDYLRERR